MLTLPANTPPKSWPYMPTLLLIIDQTCWHTKLLTINIVLETWWSDWRHQASVCPLNYNYNYPYCYISVVCPPPRVMSPSAIQLVLIQIYPLPLSFVTWYRGQKSLNCQPCSSTVHICVCDEQSSWSPVSPWIINFLHTCLPHNMATVIYIFNTYHIM